MATGSKLPNSKINLIKTSDVVDVADINNISQAVETNATNIGLVQGGTASVSVTANTLASVHVDFKTPFPSKPTVVACPALAVPQVYDGVSTDNITTTGFDIYLRTVDTRTAWIRWIAVP